MNINSFIKHPFVSSLFCDVKIFFRIFKEVLIRCLLFMVIVPGVSFYVMLYQYGGISIDISTDEFFAMNFFLLFGVVVLCFLFMDLFFFDKPASSGESPSLSLKEYHSNAGHRDEKSGSQL